MTQSMYAFSGGSVRLTGKFLIWLETKSELS